MQLGEIAALVVLAVPVLAIVVGLYLAVRRRDTAPWYLRWPLVGSGVFQLLLVLAWFEAECVESYNDCTANNTALFANGLLCLVGLLIAIGVAITRGRRH